MPPFEPIEISDDEGRAVAKPQAAPPPRPIRALAIVAGINIHLEETNSTIKAYKDDVARLKELLRSAEARLEKEQEKRLKLIEMKSEALDSGVTEVNARSGLRVTAGVKTEVKSESKVKREPGVDEEVPSLGATKQRSVFAGVRILSSSPAGGNTPTHISLKAVKTEPSTLVTRKQAPLHRVFGKPTTPALPGRSLTPPQTIGSNAYWEDNSDGNIPMGDYDSGDDYNSNSQPSTEEHQRGVGDKTVPVSRRSGALIIATSQPKLQVRKQIPTRGRGWRGSRGIGRAARSQRVSRGHPSARIVIRTPIDSHLQAKNTGTNIPPRSDSFSRLVISSAIGGQLQHTWPTPNPDGDYAIRVVRYCCLRRELNWCLPSNPGESEKVLMFSSRSFDWGGMDFPLFIREEISKWKYYGDYKVAECYKLSLQEWRGFEETQKATWCRHMLARGWGRSILAEYFPEKELMMMDCNDWEKVYALFEEEDSNPRHLRIVGRKMEFVRYNRELYDLLVEKSAIDPPSRDLKTPTTEKRKATHDDIEIGSPDDDYTAQLSSDGEDGPPRKRTRRTRRSVFQFVLARDSGGDNIEQPVQASPPRASLPLPAPPPPSSAQVTQDRVVKEELPEFSDGDLYSAPPNYQSAQTPQALIRVPLTHTGGDESNNRDSSVEMWEKEPIEWTLPTEDNDMLAASDRAYEKFDANQLIKVWPPCKIPNALTWLSRKFTRRFLSKYLGGCEQTQECIISEAKKRTQIYKLSVYYCERAEWAPDMPEKPGAHGVVYATKSGDGPVDFNYSSYPVFCRRRANEWEYCGEYQITRRGFVPGEWSRVSEIAKKSWSEGFAGKRGKWGIQHMTKVGIITEGQKVTPQDVLQFIDDGLLQLECQVYRCVGYNREMYDVLEAKWDETMKAGLAVKEEVFDDDD